MIVSSIQNVDWLLPAAKPKATLFDSLPKSPIDNLLSDIQRIKDSYLQFKFDRVSLYKNDTIASDIDYRQYIQYPNGEIKNLAMMIVSRSDSNDTKAWKLMRWVQDNIKYVDDIKNYGQDEYWALPTVTMKRKTGNCEDGAFLLGSLMLNAGVDPERVRVYGGFVFSGTNASTGGHAWVSYKREIDNQWVALDWCYYPTTDAINNRPTLKEDKKYLDDYFYITAFETVDTTYFNSLRARKAYVVNNQFKHKPVVDLVV